MNKEQWPTAQSLTPESRDRKARHSSTINMSSPTFDQANLLNSKHGSEEDDDNAPSAQTPDPDDTDPFASARRSGYSFVSSPGFTGGDDEQPKTLESRDADEMLVYWTLRVASEQARARIINLFQGMTGMQWIEMLTSSDGKVTEMLLEEDCGIKPRPERMVITSEAASAFASVGARRATSSQEEMRSKIMSDNAIVNARMKDRMEARYLAKQEADKGKLTKMDGMPQPTSGETMLTPVQLERYKVALKTYINPYDTFAAIWAASLIDDYKQDPSEYLDGLTDEQKSLDARLGARLYDKAPVCIQDILVDDMKRQHKGQESFMIMIKSIATRINFRCEARTVQLLNKYITKGESCTDPTQLLSMVQKFRMTHGVYSRMCDLDCKALYKTAIEHMLSALSKQTEMNAPLNIRMGISAVMNKDNFEKYMEDLEEVALDLTLYEAPPTAKAQ